MNCKVDLKGFLIYEWFNGFFREVIFNMNSMDSSLGFFFLQLWREVLFKNLMLLLKKLLIWEFLVVDFF